MNEREFKDGVWPVVLTPFREDGKIDFPAYRALLEYYIANGVTGLFAVCLSSELYELTAAERLEIEFSYEFYKAALEEEMERFYSAFLMKNDIFPPASKKAEEIPAAEISRSEAFKLQALMAGMGDHTRRPVLGSGVEP